MGVQLNIKDERTVILARALADRLGKSVTETIREALEEKTRAREREQEAHVTDIMAAVREVHRDLPEDLRQMTSKEIMDSIYDDAEPGGFAR